MRLNSENLAAFFKEQLSSWEQARDNYKALENVIVKEVSVGGFPFKVQFNPARIVSSSAKVDKKSIKERRCFLCSENRPQVQRGLDFVYEKDRENPYTVLINPFPIFPKHLTIPMVAHKDQLIGGRMGAMLSLAKELQDFTLFYNGPKCGASAPDHFHFQAGNRGFLPMEQQISVLDRESIFKRDHTSVWAVKTVFNGLFAIESKEIDLANQLFEKVFSVLPVKEGEPEPMVNILCWYNNGQYTILLYVRERHRPSHYFASGHSNILLSPASVDLGGVFITPLEKDFNKLNDILIKEILDQICISKEENRQIINKIKTLV
ncbi:MAG: DUF4922 domain-containing protein [Bacteroidales bacterium]|nr:DUF4922 domain-containing protein [Bacteroidales bacterium]